MNPIIPVFRSVPWQERQFHLQQNVGHRVPRQSLLSIVAKGLCNAFNAPDADEAKRLPEGFVTTRTAKAPQLTTWATEAVPECYAVLALAPTHRRCLRTNNVLERLNQELKGRTRVATLFPNAASCERVASTVAMDMPRSG